MAWQSQACNGHCGRRRRVQAVEKGWGRDSPRGGSAAFATLPAGNSPTSASTSQHLHPTTSTSCTLPFPHPQHLTWAAINRDCGAPPCAPCACCTCSTASTRGASTLPCACAAAYSHCACAQCCAPACSAQCPAASCDWCGVSATLRAAAVDWMVDVAWQLALTNDSLFLGVQCLDR